MDLSLWWHLQSTGATTTGGRVAESCIENMFFTAVIKHEIEREQKGVISDTPVLFSVAETSQ